MRYIMFLLVIIGILLSCSISNAQIVSYTDYKMYESMRHQSLSTHENYDSGWDTTIVIEDTGWENRQSLQDFVRSNFFLKEFSITTDDTIYVVWFAPDINCKYDVDSLCTYISTIGTYTSNFVDLDSMYIYLDSSGDSTNVNIRVRAMRDISIAP